MVRKTNQSRWGGRLLRTIRLLYPDFVSGGLETYYFGAILLQHILPQNENQALYKVNIAPPTGKKYEVTDGIYAKEEVRAGIEDAMNILERVRPDKVVTIGGNCIVSQAPFDYLHGIYESLMLMKDISIQRAYYNPFWKLCRK